MHIFNREKRDYFKISLENKNNISTEFRRIVDEHNQLIDSHKDVLEFYLPFFQTSVGSKPDLTTLFLSSALTNLHTLYAACELTMLGHFSSAKSLYRKIFEFLMISKYCFTTEDNNLAELWLKGGDFDLYKTTMKYMVKPRKQKFIDLWRILCQFNHGTVYSTQNVLQWTLNKNQLYECITLSYILVRCNNHLLKSILLKRVPRVKYNAEHLDQNEIRFLNHTFRESCQVFKQFVGEASTSFISEFTKKWAY